MKSAVPINNDSRHRYHVAVIGGGPSGLAAASILVSNNISTVLFEAGKSPSKRDLFNPADVSSGVGGGGLFADGKLSFNPSASKLRESYPEASMQLARSWYSLLLENLDVDIDDSGQKNADSVDRPFVKRFPSAQLNTYQRTTLLNHLLADTSSCIVSDCKIIDARCDNSGFTLIDDGGKAYFADKIIIASGRYGSSVARHVVPRHPKDVFEAGVRFETLDSSFDFINPSFPDYKIIKSIGEGLEFRTFCCARHAAVLKTRYDGLVSFNGARAEYRLPTSNIGFLVRSSSKKNDFHEELRRCSEGQVAPFSIRSSDFLKAKTPFIGQNVDAIIKSELKALFGSSAEQGVVYGPEIEKTGTYYFDAIASRDESNRVWVVGDATGRFRGLSAALLSGAACAYSIVASWRKTIKRGFGASKVNTSDVSDMNLVFTAQSKKFFYCRDAICEYVMKRGCLPVNPFRVFGYFLDDRVDRSLVRRGNNQLIRTCSELWVFGPIADGVLFEIMVAKLEGMSVRFFTVATQAHEIEELVETERGDYSRIKFEPEVHARRVSKQTLLNTIMGIETRHSQLELFDDEDAMLQ